MYGVHHFDGASLRDELELDDGLAREIEGSHRESDYGEDKVREPVTSTRAEEVDSWLANMDGELAELLYEGAWQARGRRRR